MSKKSSQKEKKDIRSNNFQLFLACFAATSFCFFLLFVSSSLINSPLPPVQLDIASLFPKHGIQITKTINIFFVEVLAFFIASISTLFLSRDKTVLHHLSRYWISFFAYIMFTHWYIWWVVQPMCITGCEGGAGGNDGTDDIFFAFAAKVPWILLVTTICLKVVAEKVKSLEKAYCAVRDMTIIQLTFLVSIPIFALLFILFPFGFLLN